MAPSLAQQAFPDDVRMAEMAEAIAAGDIERIRRLAPSINLDAQGDKDVTLLQWALLNQDIPAMLALLELGADPYAPGMSANSVLHTAAAVNTPKYLAALLERGLDPDVKNAVSGDTPLLSAAMSGRKLNVELLLKAGADINVPDRMGNTPLHIAARTGHASLALYFLQSGAQFTARNAQGRTFDEELFSMSEEFLSQAARAELDEIRAFLQEHGH